MKPYSILLIALLLTGCGSKKSSISKPLLTKLNETTEELYSKITFEVGENHAIKIDQDKSSLVKLPQKLISSLNTSFSKCEFCYDQFKKDTTITISYVENAPIYPFQLADYNFDGFVDFGFPSSSTCCSGNNVINEIWIFDRVNNSFTYNKTLSEMPIWDLKTEDETIESGWHMGSNNFDKKVYKWVEDSLLIIEEFKSENLNDSLVREVTKKMRNGKQILLKEKTNEY